MTTHHGRFQFGIFTSSASQAVAFRLGVWEATMQASPALLRFAVWPRFHPRVGSYEPAVFDLQKRPFRVALPRDGGGVKAESLFMRLLVLTAALHRRR